MSDDTNDTHVFVQRCPTWVSGTDFVRSFMIPATSREEALERLKESGELRIDALKAMNVAYAGTAAEVAGDGIVDLFDWYEQEAEPQTIEYESLPEGYHDG